MVFGSIGELIDKIKDSVVRYFDGITQQVNGKIESIRKDIEDVSKQVDGVKSAVESNNVGGDLQELKQEVADIKSGISNGVQGEINNVNKTLGNGFKDVNDSLSTLTDNVNKLIERQDMELETLRSEANEANALKATIEEKNNQLEELSKKLSETKGELFAKKQELSEKEAKIESLSGDLIKAESTLEKERQNSSDTAKELQAWKEAVADYAPVRDAMRNCETFGKLLETRGLAGDSDIALLAFVQELGKTMDFLRDVHQTALDVKRAQGMNPTLMTEEELAVYNALNRCYRCIWDIDFDVFVTPGERKPINEEFYKIPFNKDDALVLKDIRNRSLKFTKGIYVPLLLNREKKMYKPAYVEASNL